MKKFDPKNSVVAVIAGKGVAPKLVIDSLEKSKTSYVVFGVKGNTSEFIESEINEHINIGEFKKAIKLLRKNNVSHICFIGSIKRPSLSSIKLDTESALFLAKFGMKKLSQGDNTLLSSLLNYFENKGFNIVPADVLAPKLLTPKGVLGEIKPSAQDKKDIEVGTQVLTTLGESDIGQAIIVENGYVLGIEAAEGTAELVARCKKLKKESSPAGILLKRKKTNQDTRVDLPSIGIETIKSIKETGLKGIAIDANASIIIDIENVINEANKQKIFILGL